MSPRARLLQLEQEGRYVFHGSPLAHITSLEPRQACRVPDVSQPDRKVLDGTPAVAACRYSDFAIFRAIINSTNITFTYTSGFGIKCGKRVFYVSSDAVLEVARDKKGFVYVLAKDGFAPYARHGQAHEGSMEWRSAAAVVPVEVIEVGFGDLSPDDTIEILDSPARADVNGPEINTVDRTVARPT